MTVSTTSWFKIHSNFKNVTIYFSNWKKALNNDFHYLHGSLKQPNCIIWKVSKIHSHAFPETEYSCVHYNFLWFQVIGNVFMLYHVNNRFQNHMDWIRLCFKKKSYDCAQRGDLTDMQTVFSMGDGVMGWLQFFFFLSLSDKCPTMSV